MSASHSKQHHHLQARLVNVFDILKEYHDGEMQNWPGRFASRLRLLSSNINVKVFANAVAEKIRSVKDYSRSACGASAMASKDSIWVTSRSPRARL